MQRGQPKRVWREVRVDASRAEESEPLWRRLVSRGTLAVVGLALLYGGWRLGRPYAEQYERREAYLRAQGEYQQAVQAENLNAATAAASAIENGTPMPTLPPEDDGLVRPEKAVEPWAGQALLSCAVLALGAILLVLGLLPQSFVAGFINKLLPDDAH